MIKRKALNKIFITTVSIFVVLVIYSLNLKDKETVVYETYHISSENKLPIYALNDDNYLVKTTVYVDNNLSIEEKVKEVLEIMIKENNRNALLPSNLNPILPKNTSINNVTYENNILKIDFSEEFMNIEEEQSERVIEGIVYSLSEFEEIIGIEIYVNNNLLKYIPNTKNELPTLLTTDIGINKIYNLTSNKDINKVLLYYYTNISGKLSYVPVTNYVNDKREKIEIIVESLASFNNNNLISYVDNNLKLLSYENNDKVIKMNFNNKIYKDEESLNEEALDMILYSVFDNYDIEKVEVLVNDNKILEKSRKNLEK